MFGFSNSSWCMQSLKTCGVWGFGMLVASLTCSFLKALVTNSEGGGGPATNSQSCCQDIILTARSSWGGNTLR